MKIAIDLNDVVRNFSNNFLRYYIENYNHNFDLDDFEFWTDRMDELFNFSSEKSYYNFTYEDFAFELFGKCDFCYARLKSDFAKWWDEVLKNIDTEEEINVMFVSTRELSNSIGFTYYFISKMAPEVREVFMPKNAMEIWDRCDVLITASPELLNNKKENKTSIKIKTEYNKECASDYTYDLLSDFFEDENNFKNIIKKHVEQKQ